jgi:predicted dehydrogenase
MVGFNRRFSPFTLEALRLLRSIAEPIALIITVNAGAIPATHWTQDPAVGGGRLVGEACHFIDLARCLVGAPIVEVLPVGLGGGAGGNVTDDRVSMILKYADGSVATVHYLANGHRSFPKERIEIFGAGRILQIDNFRRMRGWGWNGYAGLRRWRQDKGQGACAAAFVSAIRSGGPAPIEFDELLEVSRVTVDAAESLS